MDNISRHITYAEAIRSATAARLGVSNTPSTEHIVAMKRIAERVFEPLRTYFGAPIEVGSFFRNPQVNAAIGGSATSQHMKGEAMDINKFAASNYTNAELFWYIKERLEFDQLIWEFGTESEPDWVHVSLKASNNRKQVLQAYKASGVTKYRTFNLVKKIKDFVEEKKKS